MASSQDSKAIAKTFSGIRTIQNRSAESKLIESLASYRFHRLSFRCSEDFELGDRLPCAGKRLPGVHSRLMSKAFGKIFPMAACFAGWIHGGGYLMKRIATAMLLLSSLCWAQAPDGFEPASTNVWGAAYPRIDSGGRAEFRVKAPNASKVRAAGTRLSLLHSVNRRRGIQ
jgi:hypothetical protein